ncbi:MAG: PHP domain-containing protein [Lachnospiraceae bacterium]|nr:PHP domain-containing protein [Lachnospiraceae bacterium]
MSSDRYPEIIDLHMHSVISDGTDQPEDLLQKAKEAGLDLFALTDHDAIKGCQKILESRTDEDPLFLCGVEFSCRDEEGKYHILGYAYDPDATAMKELVGLGHSYRMRKTRGRLEQLEEQFGFSFPEDEIEALLSLDNPGKPHIGNLMVKYGYAKTKEEAIRNFINRVHIKSVYVRPEEAIEGILKSGGVPVLAHPSYGDGEQFVIGEEMDARLQRLIPFGLEGVEAYYSGFTPKLIEEMLAFAVKYDLYVTAGSDYHGRNKLVEMGDTNLVDVQEGPEGLHRFLDRCLSSQNRGKRL